MPDISILSSGWIDHRDSAFPQATQLRSGEILCSFNVGGGPEVSGGTHLARSTDGGESWTDGGVILQLDESAGVANFLGLSQSLDGKTIYAYGATIDADTSIAFGQRATHAALCVSTDEGRSWSPARRVPFPTEHPLEVSHGILALDSGRLLAPTATLNFPDALGEEVLVAISEDGGATWPRHQRVFHDANGKLGFFEQKLAQFAPNQIVATAWTVTLGDYVDQPDSFTISRDGGESWAPAKSTGIRGQTMTPIPLGGNRLLVLYNKRYGQQAVVGALVIFDDDAWEVVEEMVVYDARSNRSQPAGDGSNIDELASFAFGFPTAIALTDDTFLATHWCKEEGSFGVRWTKLRVDWH